MRNELDIRIRTTVILILMGLVMLWLASIFSQLIITSSWEEDTDEIPRSVIFTFDRTDCSMYRTYSNGTGITHLMLLAPNNQKFYIPSPSSELIDFGVMQWDNKQWLILSEINLLEEDYVFEEGYYRIVQKFGEETEHIILVLRSAHPADGSDFMLSRLSTHIQLGVLLMITLGVSLIIVASFETFFSYFRKVTHSDRMLIQDHILNETQTDA